MKSVLSKLLITIISIVFAAILLLTAIISHYSSTAMTELVHDTLNTVADTTATKIAGNNEKEFKMLSTVAALQKVRDPSVSIEEKTKVLTAVRDSDKSYINVAYYTKTGDSITADGDLVNLSARPYFQEAINGKAYISDPYVSTVTKTLVIVYAIPVYDYDKNISGVVAAVLPGDKMSQICTSLHVGKNDHPVIINRLTGITVGAADQKKVESAQNIKDAPKGEMTDLLEDLCRGKSGTGSFVDPATHIKMIAIYQPVDTVSDWSVFCAAPYDDYFGALSAILRIMVIALICTVVLIAISSTIVISLIMKPLKTVDNSINEIASGNADLTRRIDISSKDEIGKVVEGFNRFTGKLQSIISDIKKSNGILNTAGTELQGSTEDTAGSITEIIANIESMNGQIVSQASSVEETAGAVNEIAANIASLERMIETQSAGVSQASAAVEQMIGNIASVNTSVEKMASSFEALHDDAQNGSSKQQDVNERIRQIEQQSQMLQEANQAIASIASQTNLLAMNAAIEAAHAGEAGKGFSVVSDEIRKLSETAAIQSKTISDQLNNIMTSIDSVVAASEESSAAFTSVSDKIKITDELVRQIKSAMSEQTEGSKQISDALHSMNNSTGEVKTASVEMSAGNKAILTEIKHLQDATLVMKESMSEMKIGAKKINETGTTLHEISGKMKDVIRQIGTQIDQFKV
jgi:methyl-accepting chemotaxis protein